jgi:hypothetical protein
MNVALVKLRKSESHKLLYMLYSRSNKRYPVLRLGVFPFQLWSTVVHFVML